MFPLFHVLGPFTPFFDLYVYNKLKFFLGPSHRRLGELNIVFWCCEVEQGKGTLWAAKAILLPLTFQPNCIILAITPANQDVATSDAIKIAREVDPTGDRTFGVLTKLDLMDRGTNALDVLEGRSYRLKHPWVGIVNRSQADINTNMDMVVARRREGDYFSASMDYGHLVNKMGSEYLAKLLSKHLESVIKARIPAIASMINKSIDELESELDHFGKPVAIDAGAQLYTILELCRAFDQIFKEHLDGGLKSDQVIVVTAVLKSRSSILKL